MLGKRKRIEMGQQGSIRVGYHSFTSLRGKRNNYMCFKIIENEPWKCLMLRKESIYYGNFNLTKLLTLTLENSNIWLYNFGHILNKQVD